MIEDGAVGDPASQYFTVSLSIPANTHAGLGVGVLLRNWTRTDTSNNIYSFYGGEQAGYLIHKAPHTADGAVSHRNDQVQLWADFVSMAPPFLAYFGATQGGPNGTWLMQYAFDQCRLYRQYLIDQPSGLWKHIVLGTYNDTTHWATGNGWAASGMMRTLQAIKRSPTANQMTNQQANLTSWISEIVRATWTHQKFNGTLLNVLDALPVTTFADTAGTALLCATTLRLATLTNDTTYVDAAVKAMELVRSSIDAQGWLRGTVDPYTFNIRLNGSGNDKGSPEGQAFILMVRFTSPLGLFPLDLIVPQMHAAWRDYLAAGGQYTSTTPSGSESASIPTATPSSANMVVVYPHAILRTIMLLDLVTIMLYLM